MSTNSIKNTELHMESKPTHKAKSLDGQWVEGWYDGSDQDFIVMVLDKFKIAPINPSTLCRSTYRTDSNGKLMYEGDEVMHNGKLWNIEWIDSICAFVLKRGKKAVVPFTLNILITLTGKNSSDEI